MGTTITVSHRAIQEKPDDIGDVYIDNAFATQTEQLQKLEEQSMPILRSLQFGVHHIEYVIGEASKAEQDRLLTQLKCVDEAAFGSNSSSA
jgi:hypothetical protein